MSLTVKELMERMPGAFIPEKAEGVDAVILFELGEDGGNWVCTIKDQTCTVEEGPSMTRASRSSQMSRIILIWSQEN